MAASVVPHCVWPVGAELGEGPLWSPLESALWFVDIKQNKLHRYDPSSGVRRSYDTPPSPSFIVPARNGTFVVGLQSGLHRFDPVTGVLSLLLAVEPDRPGNRLNDGALDSKGRLWFGSMDNSETEKTGSLFRLDSNAATVVDSGYVITNGPCFSPDGRILYHTDTRANTIYAFDVADDGSLSGKRVFVTIEPGAGHPDGSVTDAQGYIWTCLFLGWAARRYAPSGELISEVRFPCSNITKLAFGGAELRTAYVTTARHLLTTAQRAQQPLAGGLFTFAVDVPGLRQGVLHE
jgi:sugar lactone lactonase YvrE